MLFVYARPFKILLYHQSFLVKCSKIKSAFLKRCYFNFSGGWTHIEDLDSFFTRMYRYYVRGGFYPMIISDLFYLLQFIFIVWFSTFLVYCVDYQMLFRNNPGADRTAKLSLNEVISSPSVCVKSVAWKW